MPPEVGSGGTCHFIPFSESKSSGIYVCCASLYIWSIGRRGFSLCLAMQNLLAAGFAFPHPNDGTEKPDSPARVAARLFASRRMLSHFVFSWGYGASPHVHPSPCPFIPEPQSSRTRLSRPRRRPSFPEDKSLRIGFCPGSIMLSPHYNYSKGGMGLRPMFTQALALSYPNSKAAEPAFPARAAGSPSQRIKASA